MAEVSAHRMTRPQADIFPKVVGCTSVRGVALVLSDNGAQAGEARFRLSWNGRDAGETLLPTEDEAISCWTQAISRLHGGQAPLQPETASPGL